MLALVVLFIFQLLFLDWFLDLLSLFLQQLHLGAWTLYRVLNRLYFGVLQVFIFYFFRLLMNMCNMIFVMSLLSERFTAKSAHERLQLIVDHYMVPRIRPLRKSFEAVETAVLIFKTLFHLHFITLLRRILNLWLVLNFILIDRYLGQSPLDQVRLRVLFILLDLILN